MNTYKVTYTAAYSLIVHATDTSEAIKAACASINELVSEKDSESFTAEYISGGMDYGTNQNQNVED